MTFAEQRIIIGNSLNVLRTMPPESVDVCVTSPPYWGLRDYGDNTVDDYDGWRGQLGLESAPKDYIEHLCQIFDEVKRVLKPTGALWVNIGDTYNGTKTDNTDVDKNGKVATDTFTKPTIDGIGKKSLCQIPSRFAIAMTDRGWILRNECVWHKPNIMPTSAKDRFTNDFEKFYFFVKNQKYYFKQQFEPIKEVSLKRAEYGFVSDKMNMSAKSPTGGGVCVSEMGTRFANPKGRNCRAVWTIPTSGSKYNHIAMFPESLIERPIDSCCPDGGVVLDPFCGSGTVLAYCRRKNISAIGIEIDPDNEAIIMDRLNRAKDLKVKDLTEWIG